MEIVSSYLEQEIHSMAFFIKQCCHQKRLSTKIVEIDENIFEKVCKFGFGALWKPRALIHFFKDTNIAL